MISSLIVNSGWPGQTEPAYLSRDRDMPRNPVLVCGVRYEEFLVLGYTKKAREV